MNTISYKLYDYLKLHFLLPPQLIILFGLIALYELMDLESSLPMNIATIKQYKMKMYFYYLNNNIYILVFYILY